MNAPTHRLDHLVHTCRGHLGDPALWPPARLQRPSLALCVIDAVQAGAGHYATVVGLLDRYSAYRAAQPPAPEPDGVRALLRTFEEVGGAHPWTGKVGNYKRAYGAGSLPLRARTISAAAQALYQLRVDSVADLRALCADARTLAVVHRAWRGAVPQDGTLLWHYLLSLAGVPGLGTLGEDAAARFVEAATGDRHVPPWDARAALFEVAGLLGVEGEDLCAAVTRWGVAVHRRSPLRQPHFSPGQTATN